MATVLYNVVFNDTTKWDGSSREVPYVGLEHIRQDRGNLEGVGNAAEVVSAKNVFKVGDVLFGKLRPNLKKYWQAEFEGICSTDILVLRPLEGISNEYLYYLVQSKSFLNLAMSDAVGTKMPRTSWKRLGGFEFLLPPLPEQRRIAEILSSVDDSIRATEAVMAQAERVKRGMMEDLLTDGLGSEAITRGAVPKDWVPKVLHNVVVNYTTKWDGASREAPYVGLEHIGQDSGNLERLGSAAEVVSAKNVFKVGDVLFGKLRPNLKKYWQAEFEGICSTDILVLRPFGSILNEYLYYLVQSHPFLSLAISDAVGTKMPRTSWKRLGGFEFLLPPLPEQRRITEILSSVDDQIAANRASAEQLRRLKRGLMDDLLTGRVRTVS